MTDLASARVYDSQVGSDVVTLGAEASSSFREMYNAHADMVFRTVRRCGVAGAEVEDVVQEVFLKLHRTLATFEDRSTFLTWVYRIARNTAINHRRDRRHDAENALFEESNHVSNAASPEDAYAQNEALSTLDILLRQLDESKREVLLLTELESFSAPEIAEIVNIPVNTVYSRLRIARDEFQVALRRHNQMKGVTP